MKNLGLTPSTVPTDPPSGSAVTTWIYGPTTGRLDRKQYADTKGTDYTYTTAGRLQTRVWSRLNAENLKLKTSYGYTHGLLTSTDYNDATPDVLITYESLGRQKSVSTSVAKSVFVYDPATLRLDTETISYNLDTVAGYEFSRVLDRSNDIHGRSKGYELKDNTMIDAKANYDYDPLTGRLETVDDGGLSQYIYGDNSFTYTYVENSTSNLIGHVSGGMVRVYNTWEPNRDILKEKENLSRTLVKNYSTFTYTTNAIGQREKVVAIGENPPNVNNTAFERTWGYDSRGQLTQENDTQNDVYDRGFAYDAIGNRTKSISGNTNVTEPAAVSYTPNALNQYSAITDPASALMTPLYDDDGNTKSSSIRPTGMPGVNLQTAGYDWDAENRLVKINTKIIQYDAFGRRIAKKDGNNYQSIWVYDGWNPIALYGSPTDLYENYLWGLDISGSLQGAGGVGGLLAISDSDYNVHYPTYDGNGNVSEYIEPYPDPDFYFPYDFVAAHYEYDAFGNVTNSEGWSASDFPFRFSTKQQDDESGLLYYGYRYYDPLTGRWPSRDPIEEEGGVNLYGFVGNDGVDMWDYLGKYNPYITGSGHDDVGQAEGPTFHANDLGLTLDKSSVNSVSDRAKELDVCNLGDGAKIGSGNIEVLAIATNQMSVGHLSAVISGTYTVFD